MTFAARLRTGLWCDSVTQVSPPVGETGLQRARPSGYYEHVLSAPPPPPPSQARVGILRLAEGKPQLPCSSSAELSTRRRLDLVERPPALLCARCSEAAKEGAAPRVGHVYAQPGGHCPHPRPRACGLCLCTFCLTSPGPLPSSSEPEDVERTQTSVPRTQPIESVQKCKTVAQEKCTRGLYSLKDRPGLTYS